MWTERDKVLDNVSEIVQYLDTVNSFHDYKLGNISFDGCNLIVMIEDAHTKNNREAHIWNFTFNHVTQLYIDMDCVLRPFLTEVEIVGQSVIIGLTNGSISFNAIDIMLGIPKH